MTIIMAPEMRLTARGADGRVFGTLRANTPTARCARAQAALRKPLRHAVQRPVDMTSPERARRLEEADEKAPWRPTAGLGQANKATGST